MKRVVFLLVSTGCLPALQTPPPGTPAKTIEQCGADASAHNIELGTGAALVAVSLGTLLTATLIANGQNGTEVNTIAAAGAGAGVAGLVLAAVAAPLTTLKYNDDGCATLTGPLYKKR